MHSSLRCYCCNYQREAFCFKDSAYLNIVKFVICFVFLYFLNLPNDHTHKENNGRSYNVYKISLFFKLPGTVHFKLSTDPIQCHFSWISNASSLVTSSFYIISTLRSFLIICLRKQYSSRQEWSPPPTTKGFLTPGFLIISFLLRNSFFLLYLVGTMHFQCRGLSTPLHPILIESIVYRYTALQKYMRTT